jgi:hypothetical protein
MQISEVFNSLFAAESHNLEKMPGSLATFIESLVKFAQKQGVNSREIYDNLSKRQFGTELSKSSASGFDSNPASLQHLENFVSLEPLSLTTEAFDKDSRRLKTTGALKAMVEFINSPDGDHPFRRMADERRVPVDSKLDPNDEDRAKRIDLMGTLINESIKFDKPNHNGRINLKIGRTNSPFTFFQNSAQKLMKMESVSNHGLSESELEGLGNSGGLSRGGFIDWLMKVAADAARGNVFEANSIGMKNYDDLLKVINNIHLLSKN